jgi:hypothetical protein
VAQLFPCTTSTRVVPRQSPFPTGAGHVARMGEKISIRRVLVGKSERRKSLGRTRRRWPDNIKINF